MLDLYAVCFLCPSNWELLGKENLLQKYGPLQIYDAQHL